MLLSFLVSESFPLCYYIFQSLKSRVPRLWCYWHLGWNNSLLWGCLLPYRMFIRVSHLRLLGTSSPSHGLQKCLQTLSHVPWGRITPRREPLILGYLRKHFDMLMLTIFLYFENSSFSQHGRYLWWKWNYLQLSLQLLSPSLTLHWRVAMPEKGTPLTPLKLMKTGRWALRNILPLCGCNQRQLIQRAFLPRVPWVSPSLPSPLTQSVSLTLGFPAQADQGTDRHEKLSVSLEYAVRPVMWQGFLGSGDKRNENSCCGKANKPHLVRFK